MKSIGKKNSRKTRRAAVAEIIPTMPAPPNPRAVTFEVLRPEIHAEVTSNAVEMVRAMIQHAKDGQYQAMKYLFEMVGLYPANTDEESPREESLTGMLLKRLEIPNELSGQRGDGQRVSTQADAVE